MNSIARTITGQVLSGSTAAALTSGYLVNVFVDASCSLVIGPLVDSNWYTHSEIIG